MGRKNTRKVSDARAAARAGAAWSLGQSIIDPPPRRALDFLDKHILTWIANYLKVVFLLAVRASITGSATWPQ